MRIKLDDKPKNMYEFKKIVLSLSGSKRKELSIFFSKIRDYNDNNHRKECADIWDRLLHRLCRFCILWWNARFHQEQTKQRGFRFPSLPVGKQGRLR